MVCACLSRRLVTLHTSRRRRSQNRGASAVAVRHLSYIVLRYDRIGIQSYIVLQPVAGVEQLSQFDTWNRNPIIHCFTASAHGRRRADLAPAHAHARAVRASRGGAGQEMSLSSPEGVLAARQPRGASPAEWGVSVGQPHRAPGPLRPCRRQRPPRAARPSFDRALPSRQERRGACRGGADPRQQQQGWRARHLSNHGSRDGDALRGHVEQRGPDDLGRAGAHPSVRPPRAD